MQNRTEVRNNIAQNVERVYLTRGDNLFDEDGISCDKAVGIQVKGLIYWIDESWAVLNDLDWVLDPFNLALAKGKNTVYFYKGVTINDTTNFKDGKPCTKISKHLDDIFTTGSSYMAKSARHGEKNSIWWGVDELFNHLATIV